MLTVILCVCLVAASAAPHRFSRHFPFDDDSSYEDIFESRSMGQFWRNFENEMKSLQDSLSEITKNLPQVTTTNTVDGNEYKLTMGLSGFKEDDITVKAREGTFVVEAHNRGNNFISVQSLPENVKAEGNWTFENNVLTITFPIDKTKPLHTSPIQTTGSNVVILDDSVRDRDVYTNVIGKDELRNLDGHAKNVKDEVELIHQ